MMFKDFPKKLQELVIEEFNNNDEIYFYNSYTKEDFFNNKVTLIICFDWSSTTQGRCFWENIDAGNIPKEYLVLDENELFEDVLSKLSNIIKK